MAVDIDPVSEVNEEIVAALAYWVPQLSRSAAPVTFETLRHVVECPTNTLSLLGWTAASSAP